MSSLKQRVMRRAKELGVEIEVRYDSREVIAEAPTFSVFASTGTHGVVASVGCTFSPMAHCWLGILDDMSFGLESCDCEDCNEEHQSQ